MGGHNCQSNSQEMRFYPDEDALKLRHIPLHLRERRHGDALAAWDFGNLRAAVVIGILSLPDLKDRYSRHALFPRYPFVSPAALVDRIDSPSSRDRRHLHTGF